MGIYKETIRKYMVGHQMRQIVSNNGVLDLAQFYLDATAVGATQDKALFEAELNALPTLVKNGAETILVPGINKTGKVYGLNGATKGLVEFDFSRASSATYFDKNGILKTASADMPRITFNPLTKKCEGFLIEKPSINYGGFLRPIMGSPIFVENAGQSVFGTQTATKLTSTGSSSDACGIQHMYGAAGVTYTISFNIENIDADSTNATVRQSETATSLSIQWNGKQLVGFSGSGSANATFVQLTNNIYRVSLTYVSVEGIQRLRLYPDYSIVNRSVLIHNAQIEEGPVATSYIQPSGSDTDAVRAGDAFNSVADIVPYEEASVRMDMRVHALGSEMSLSKGTAGRFWYNTSDPLVFRTHDGTYLITPPNQPTVVQFNRYAASYGSRGMIGSFNGGPVVSSQYSGSFGSGFLRIGGTGLVIQTVKSLAIFSRQLTDQEHIDITT